MKHTRNSTTALLFALALTGTPAVADSVAIVAHPSLQNMLSAEQVRRIYMGRLNQLPNGSQATPVIVQHAEHTHAQFARTVLNRSTKQLRSYWAKRLFTGKSKPPLSVESLQEMKKLVSRNEGYIGYILLSDTDETVKTVFVAADS